MRLNQLTSSFRKNGIQFDIPSYLINFTRCIELKIKNLYSKHYKISIRMYDLKKNFLRKLFRYISVEKNITKKK